MNSSSRAFWLSLGCAVFAMFLIYSYSQEQKAAYDKRFGTTKTVLVATRDILEMSTIDETMVTQEEKPVDFLQPGYAENPDDVVSLVAAAPIKKGEQILLTKLLTPGPNTGLSFQVAPDKRAVAVPVDEVRGAGKLVRPGDRVDVITSISYGAGQGERREVKTLLQDVLVLATGQNVTNNIPKVMQTEVGANGKQKLLADSSYGTVMLEVTPVEAQNLIYILSVAPGSVFLTLRNSNDRAVGRFPTSTVERVLGVDSEMSVQSRIQAARNQATAAAAAAAAGKQAPQKKSPFVEIRGSEIKY